MPFAPSNVRSLQASKAFLQRNASQQLLVHLQALHRSQRGTLHARRTFRTLGTLRRIVRVVRPHVGRVNRVTSGASGERAQLLRLMPRRQGLRLRLRWLSAVIMVHHLAEAESTSFSKE